MSPRQHGTGSLTTRQTKRHGEVYYGQFWASGKKVSRRLGPARQPGSKTGLTEKQANALLARMIADYVAPAEPEDGNGIRFPEAGKRYLTYLKRQGRKKSTIQQNESALRVWIVPHFKQTPLERVTFEQVEALVEAMEAKLSPKSVKNYMGVLSALYRYGMNERRRWAASNPCEGIDLPAVQESAEIRFLTLEEVDALIRAVPDVVTAQGGSGQRFPNVYAELDRVLYRVASQTGLRQGELIALRWQDVDWPVGKIRVRRNYVLGEYGTPKSRRSSRAVPMGDEVQQVLAAWQPHDASDDDLVFADPITAGPLTSNAAILRRFRKALQLARLPDRRFHDLRHTFGTQCAANGVPIVTIKEWMGHRDVTTTMRYADYAPSAHETAMLNRAFARPVVSEGVLCDVPAVDKGREAI